MWSGVGGFVWIPISFYLLLGCSWFYLIWIYFFVGLLSAYHDDVNLIIFYRDVLTEYSFHDLLYFGCLFYSNLNHPYIGSLSCSKGSITWNIYIWFIDISHIIMLKIISNCSNLRSPWWKHDCCFKYLFFN